MKTNTFLAKKMLVALFAMLMPMLASAEKVEIDGIWYNLVPKAKQAEVTGLGNTGDFNLSEGITITIPATVTYDGVEYSVTSIGERAFYGCRSLTAITLSEGLTSIGDNAFSYCSSLTASNIPKGVTSIGDHAFSDCSSLTNITIPESVTSIGGYAFMYCYSLSTITIPEGVTSIGDHAFYSCTGLTSITLPESVTRIGNSAFHSCSSLAAITLPESVTRIEWSTFGGCTSLTSITLPESVTSIGDEAFAGCTSLTSIVLPKSVTKIWDKAFANCPELTDVYCFAESVPSTYTDAFDGSYPEYATLHVPTSALESYKSTAPWSSFGTIVSLDAAITRITLNQSSATITEGDTLTLTITTTPENADRNLISWSSSNPSVATVDNAGKVTAIAAGTTTITAMANDGSGVSTSCEVTVKELILGTCAPPAISYEDGKIVLTCETEGVEFKTCVVIENGNEYIGAEFNYIPTQTFTTYATKENYENSDEATLTLCWVPCSEEHESEDTGILTIPAQPVFISTQGGTITLSGLAEDTEVVAYNTSGQELATAIATDGTATLNTGLGVGSTAIVKIGNNSIKIAIK